MNKIEVISNDYLELVNNIEEYFEKSKDTLHDARNKIKIISYGDDKLVVKRFKKPHIVNKIAYSFIRSSKAKRSYEYANKIKDFTPSSIGYIEVYKNNLINESYYISSFFDYDYTMKEPLNNKSFENKEFFLHSFVEFVSSLHENNILHLDFSPGNILIQKSEDGFCFKIVDINRMQFKELSADDRFGNFMKLGMSESDLQIVIKQYCKINNLDFETNFNKILLLTKKHKEKVIKKRKLKKLFKGK